MSFEDSTDDLVESMKDLIICLRNHNETRDERRQKNGDADIMYKIAVSSPIIDGLCDI